MTGPGRHADTPRHPKNPSPPTQAVVAEVPPASWGVLLERASPTQGASGSLRSAHLPCRSGSGVRDGGTAFRAEPELLCPQDETEAAEAGGCLEGGAPPQRGWGQDRAKVWGAGP